MSYPVKWGVALKTTVVAFTPIWTLDGTYYYDVVLPETVNLSKTIFRLRKSGGTDAAWNGMGWRVIDNETIRIVNGSNSNTEQLHIEIIEGVSYAQHIVAANVSGAGNKTLVVADVQRWDDGKVLIDCPLFGAASSVRIGSASDKAYSISNIRLTASDELSYHYTQRAAGGDIPFQIYRI